MSALGKEGQVTLLSSENVSLSFLPARTKIFGFFSVLFCVAIIFNPLRRRSAGYFRLHGRIIRVSGISRFLRSRLLGLFMLGMLLAERAVL